MFYSEEVKIGRRTWVYIYALIAAFVVLATAGFHRLDDYNFHKYDGYLETPESAALKCIEELNSGDGKYPKKVSLYHFIEKTGKGTSQEPEEVRRIYRYNQLMDALGARSGYDKMVESAWDSLHNFEFAEPVKVIWQDSGEILFKSRGHRKVTRRDYSYHEGSKETEDDMYRDIWLGVIQASNGNWYLTRFTNEAPYDWEGNEPLTVKNREYGQAFIEEADNGEIFRLFTMASAACLNSDTARSGFLSPGELGAEDYLYFYLGTLEEPEWEAAHVREKKRYRFTDRQVGSRIWEYLGSDENYRNTVHEYSYPYGKNDTSAYEQEDWSSDSIVFTEEEISGMKLYSPDGMELVNRELLDNGMVLLEIEYREDISPVTNYQRLKLRVMEEGCRILSYQIIDPGRESEGNRILEEVAWMPWDDAVAVRCEYEDGKDEPEITQRWMNSEEAEPVRRGIRNMALGKTVPMDLGDAVSIQAVPASIMIKEFLYIRVKSGGHERRYELYHGLEEGKSRLVLLVLDNRLAVGSSGDAGVSADINGLPITMEVTGQRGYLCDLDDSGVFEEMIEKAVERREE
ncbi:hypothetical protein [uncultured Clostridium sp.]|uniref:hypothetical protein n=1 Tax=uncultured Clostridium sp. TaxID=59620 RepID=UPI0026008BE0|nr:hypothetical protein [uncultured Clostridium sp.]